MTYTPERAKERLMNYFDARTSRALMDNRLQEATRASDRRTLRFTIVAVMKARVGAWMIERGERLISNEPKIA